MKSKPAQKKAKSHPPGRPRTSAAFSSYRQVSSLYGWRVEDMKRWIREGCPARRGGKLYADEMLAWLETNKIDPTPPDADEEGGDIMGTPEEVNRERVKKMRLEQRKLDREHEVEMGLLVYRESVKQDLAIIMEGIVGILKKNCDRQLYNIIARQFQTLDFRKLADAPGKTPPAQSGIEKTPGE